MKKVNNWGSFASASYNNNYTNCAKVSNEHYFLMNLIRLLAMEGWPSTPASNK